MPTAIFRITQEGGRDTGLAQDPYMQLGFYSQGAMGTARYANEPVHLVAAPRKSGYPRMRWTLLAASRPQIGAILHTESHDFLIAKAQLVDCRIIGPTGAEVYDATLDVKNATSLRGGGMWHWLQTYQVTRDDDDEGIVDDVKNLRGRKLAGRAAGWVWDKINPF